MKKNLKLFTGVGVATLLVGVLAACGPTDGSSTPATGDGYSGTMTISGPANQQEWLQGVLADYNKERVANGEKEIKFEFVAHGEDKVDSEIADWKTGPDVYAYASDKIMPLYQKNALATVAGEYKDFIKDTMTEGAVDAATFAGKMVSYPYAGDNGCFLYYNKSLVTLEDTATIEGLLAKAGEKGLKVAYPLKTAFYSAGALFSFGARYNLSVDDAGVVTSVEADFDTDKGVKAGNAIYQIMTNPNWQDTQAAPIEANGLVACVGGSWNAAAYKEAMGDNFAATKLPTVTVDGETVNLSSFLGYKNYGVNPQVSAGDNARLKAAHNVARYLCSEEVQMKRFETFSTAPTNKVVAAKEEVKSDIAVAAISAQAEFAVPQTAVPGKIWSAPVTFTEGIEKGEITPDNMAAALKTLNEAVEASK